MKKHFRLRTVVGAIAIIIAMTMTVFAASYDSSEDPIVSLSYLTDIFRPAVEKDYTEKIDELNEKIQTLEKTIDDLTENGIPEKETETET